MKRTFPKYGDCNFKWFDSVGWMCKWPDAEIISDDDIEFGGTGETKVEAFESLLRTLELAYDDNETDMVTVNPQ